MNKKALNKPFNVNIEFTNNSTELLETDYSKIVNQYDVFENERNSCKLYRLTVTPNIIATNVLSQVESEVYDSNGIKIVGNDRISLLQKLNHNYTYKFGYDIFNNHFLRLNTFKTGDTITDYTAFELTNMLTIQKTMRYNLINDNGWSFFYNKTKINNNKMVSWKEPNERVDLFPSRDYFSLKPFRDESNVLNYNWDYIITYPYKNEKNNLLVSNLDGVNGLPIFRTETGHTNENGNYLEIQIPYKHGLNAGDIIRIKDSSYQTGDTYQIYSIGDINGENKSSVFLLDIDKYANLKNNTYLQNIQSRRIVKYTNGVESEYYIRVFKKLEPEVSSDIYKLGFAKNVYSDDIHQIQYIEDINVDNITDNLDRGLSELYMTFIKRNHISDVDGHNNVFTDLVSGVDELPGVNGYHNVRILNSNNGNEDSLENNITKNGSSYGENTFFGDIVEYNKYEVKEYVLEDIKYRFNLINREKKSDLFYHDFYSYVPTNDYPTLSNEFVRLKKIQVPEKNEGYFYSPHYKITIKNISNIKKQGELSIIQPCDGEPFISGTTELGELVLLNNNSNIQYLLLKINDINSYKDYDRVRVSKLNTNKDIIANKTFNIRLFSNVPNNIAIPYDNIFWGNIDNINNSSYSFSSYYSPEIPSNATSITEDKVFWRDIQKEGIFDENSVLVKDLTFTNGRLYLNKNLNLYIRRQDPFGYYGLKDKNFPSDISGNEKITYLTNNRYETPNNIC